MKTYHEFCEYQIFRFAGQREWPDPHQYPGAIADLTAELERVSKGDTSFAVRVVDACKSSTEFCPRVKDLAAVALELRTKDKAARPVQRRCPSGLCDGSGFIIVYALWTVCQRAESGARWIEKEWITEAQYKDLNGKITDWAKQRTYSGAKRCQCHPAREENEVGA